MNYTEMLFNRDERLVNLLNQADSKNLELIEEINNREEEIERLNNIIKEVREYIMSELITEYGIKYGGNVSGSDLPVEAITPILAILDKGDEIVSTL